MERKLKIDLLIQNGSVVFPRVGIKKVDIAVENGKIIGIFESGEELAADRIINATGLHVLPGVIDAHQHLGIYNSIEEDFLDTKEHAVGGITTVVNYDRQPVSYLEWFPQVQEIGEKNSYIDFTYSLGILKEEHLDELEAIVDQLGITSFKFFRNYEQQLNDKFKITDGIDLSSHDLKRILERFNSVSPKLLLGVHCENMDINRSLTKQVKEEGKEDGLRTWSETSPGYAEAESLLSTLYINHIAGGNIQIVHLTSGASMDVLENVPWLLEKGVKVETCPHYLTLTEDSSVGLKAKVGPPIHGEYDKKRLWEGIEKGIINAIGTDHVPNSTSTKFAKGEGAFDALFGFPSAGTLLPLMVSEGHLKRGIPLERIADITSFQVAESFNLPTKGRIEVGADADFAILNLAKKKIVSTDLLHSKSDYSLYEGQEVSGWPVYTIGRGEVIVEDGLPTSENGRGKFIRRTI